MKLYYNEMPEEQRDGNYLTTDRQESERRGGTYISSYSTKMKKGIANFFQSCLVLTENSRGDSRVPTLPSSHPVIHRQLKNDRQEAEMDVVSVSFSCNDHFKWSQLHFPPSSIPAGGSTDGEDTLTPLRRSQALAEVNPSWNRRSCNARCPRKGKAALLLLTLPQISCGTLGMSFSRERGKVRLGVH